MDNAARWPYARAMSSARRCLSFLVTAGAACALAGAGAAGAATITVNSGGDALANDGQCTLREAVLSSTNLTATGGCAPAASGDDTIVLAVGRVTLSQAGAYEDNGMTGDLDVHRTLTIQGAPGGTTIDGAHLDRVLDVLAGGGLTLQDVTVTGGVAPVGSDGFGTGTNGGGQLFGNPGDPGGDGGGIRSAGALTLRRVTVTQNATGGGGDGAGDERDFVLEFHGRSFRGAGRSIQRPAGRGTRSSTVMPAFLRGRSRQRGSAKLACTSARPAAQWSATVWRENS